MVADAAPAGVLRDKTGYPFEVRRYLPSDRPLLESFYQAFEPKRVAQGLPPHHAEGIAAWLDAVLDRGLHLLAILDQDLVGHAFLVPMNRSDAAEYAVFLRADVRGRGIGTALNRMAVEGAPECGFQRIWLTVEPRNRAAIRSYEKAGFRFLPHTIYTPEAEMELILPVNGG